MNDNRNMILAIVLSALVLIGWSALSEQFFPTSGPQTQRVEDGKVVPVPVPQADPTADRPRAIRSRAQVLASTPRVRIETPSLAGSINLAGARIDDLVLVRHSQTIGRESPPVRLLSPGGAPGAYFAGFGWIGEGGVAAPNADTVWLASANVLAPGKPVTLSWTNPTGQRFELIYSIDEGYLVTVRQRVANLSPNAVAVRPFGLVSRASKSDDPDGWTMHVGPMAFLNNEANYEVDYGTIDDEGAQRFTSDGGWLGFTDKYWMTALAPGANAPITATFQKSPTGAYQADYYGNPVVVAPGQAVTNETHLFAGAKEKAWLDAYEEAGITKLSKSIDWGWFEWFMRPIFDLLNWLFKVLGNFGLAIIALTFIVRLLLFPIADKQFRSMAGMRRVQPKMKAIQERYKDDRAKLQQEMLKLYQEEKINPAAGCLPILLQIPVFYALYK